MLLVARIVHARDRLAHAVALLRDLRDHEVVLVVARHGEQELGRSRDPGPLEDRDLRRVAADHDRPELLLESCEPIRALLDHRHLVAEVEQRARHVRADLPAAGDDRVHQAALAGGVAARTVSRSDRRSRSASGRRCSSRDRRRASRAPGRGCGRRRCRCRSASGAPGRSRCSCCRRSSRRRPRRPPRRRARSSTVTSMP